MTTNETSPIACTLAPGDLRDRMASISELTRDALRSYSRNGLALDLRYAPEAHDRVQHLVLKERACCAFLSFDLRRGQDEVQLIITAPDAVRDAADVLFEQFITAAPAPSACACPMPSGVTSASGKQTGIKAASFSAITLATGAVACGACCVLPFALPAAVLAGAGGVLAWIAHAQVWLTGSAILAVIGAWAWIAWQTARSRLKPAASTLIVMVAATGLVLIAILWPMVEGQLRRVLLA